MLVGPKEIRQIGLQAHSAHSYINYSPYSSFCIHKSKLTVVRLIMHMFEVLNQFVRIWTSKDTNGRAYQTTFALLPCTVNVNCLQQCRINNRACQSVKGHCALTTFSTVYSTTNTPLCLSHLCVYVINLIQIQNGRLHEVHSLFVYRLSKNDELQISGGSKGGARPSRPPGPKFLHFHAVFGKNWPNNRLAPPPLGNPGSAPANE